MLISPLQKNNKVSIFLCTYDNEFTDELVELYKPTQYKIIPFGGSHQIDTYVQSMENLRGYDFDFVIATRFDVHFNKSIDVINIDFYKFNALFPEKGWYNKIKWWPVWRKSKYIHHICLPFFARFVTDNLFAFPYVMLDDFISVLRSERAHPTRRGLMDMHPVFNRMKRRVGKNNVHLVSLEEERSDINSFYSLCRKK
jgi:hypothetical protein